jgi:hypothetical protein
MSSSTRADQSSRCDRGLSGISAVRASVMLLAGRMVVAQQAIARNVSLDGFSEEIEKRLIM